MLDDGRLTDSKGRTVNFTNTSIIMTSNIGSDKIMSNLKDNKPKGELRTELTNELQTFFRPEFLNRIDETIIFDPITPEALTHIVDIQLTNLAQKLQSEKNITLTVSDDAKKLLADTGYDPLFGARPLKRTIQNLVLDELAMQLLEGKIDEGETMMIDAKGGKIHIS
jgi:ATP-dependent Clp protease ATP-binding subunit ClpB